MGFFSDIKQIAKESHGRVLANQIYQHVSALEFVDEQVRYAAFMGFAEKRFRILSAYVNWSKKGRLEMGKELQGQGRKTIPLNQAEGYALWFSGAWLEGICREGIEIEAAIEVLAQIADEAEPTLRKDGFIE